MMLHRRSTTSLLGFSAGQHIRSRHTRQVPITTTHRQHSLIQALLSRDPLNETKYEKELMQRIQILLRGEFARAMLIEIQKTMLELNQILRANEINFSILAALPSLFLSLVVLMLLRASVKQDTMAEEGRGKIARVQRRLLIVDVDKKIVQFQHCIDQGLVKYAHSSASQTLSAGTRLKEGCHINRRLLTLGAVIRKLSNSTNGHVPYSDSKQTRILQNSVGGNAKTAIYTLLKGTPREYKLNQSNAKEKEEEEEAMTGGDGDVTAAPAGPPPPLTGSSLSLYSQLPFRYPSVRNSSTCLTSGTCIVPARNTAHNLRALVDFSNFKHASVFSPSLVFSFEVQIRFSMRNASDESMQNAPIVIQFDKKVKSYVNRTIGTVAKSAKYALGNLKKWTASKRVKLPLGAFPSTAKLVNEPLGVVLIISSWNFPFVQRLERETKIRSMAEETVMQPLVQLQQQETIMKVLVAIDESEGSLYALQWALQNLFLHQSRRDTQAPAEEGPAMITVVHVQPPFQPPFTAVPVGPVLFATPTVMDSVKKAQDECAADVLSRASKLCEQHKIKAETVLIRGNPKEIIVEAAEEMNVDLLVVGSRGLGQIKRAFLGSVSDYCAHHAKCPVLIVRPPKQSSK
ncbi:hypothetical protein L2E82_32920 [Cichorium intybus]|uniref:Uncharacterized protein n=1 Tax=Cichorium intybus TaxID=13427 RepID=A0ACB9BIT4_CICIN|nr:hypothetical protein L2E82_32920 [Cichorium intybus]